jgi:hypothetical protein
MSEDVYAKRRKAALHAFENSLSDEGLIDALWDIEEGLRGDGITEVIRIVDKIAKREQIDLHGTKLLYPALFAALKKAPEELPLDPWPMMVAARPARAQAAQKRAVTVRVQPGVGVVMPPVVVPPPSPPPPPPPPPPLPPPPPPSGGQMWEFVDIA